MAIQVRSRQQRALIPQNVSSAYSRAGSSRVNTTQKLDFQSAQQANTISAGLNLGQAALGLAQKKIVERDNLQLTEAINALEKEQIAFENDYMQKNQGKNASTSSEDFENFTTTKAAEISENLQLSSRANSVFLQKANNAAISSFSRGLNFQTQQEGIYKDQVAADAQATHVAVINANPSDYARIAESTATFKAEINALYPDRDNTKIFDQQANSDAQLMLNSLLAQGDEQGARKLYEETKTLLGNQAPQFESKIGQLEEVKQAEYKAMRITSSAQMANKLYFENGKNPNIAISAIADNKDLSPEEQRLAANEFLSMVSTQERIENLQQQKAQTLSKQQIALDMSNMTDPMQMREYISTLPLEMRSYANEYFNLALNGGDTVSNQEYLSEFRTQVQQGHIRTDNFDIFAKEYAPYISQADIIKLRGEMRAKEEQNLADYTKTMFNRDMQNNFGITSTEANKLYNVLDAEAYELGITDPQKKRDYILGQAQKVTVDKGFFSSEEDVPLRQAKEFAALGYEVTIPEDFRQAINKQAALEGKTIDENFIVTQYFNFLEGTLEYNPIETGSTNVATNP